MLVIYHHVKRLEEIYESGDNGIRSREKRHEVACLS